MTIPSWHVVHSFTLTYLEPADDVLQDFIQGVADVQASIGVGRSVMEDESVFSRLSSSLPGVEVVGALFQVGRPPFRDRAGRECRSRELEGGRPLRCS